MPYQSLREKQKLKQKQFFTNTLKDFAKKKVGKTEINNFQDSAILAGKFDHEIIELFYKKEQQKRLITAQPWHNMLQVYARSTQYGAYASLEKALEYFEEGSEFLYSKIKPYLSGPSAFFPEICYDENKYGQRTFFIHMHIMCEEFNYEIYKMATKGLSYRLGRDATKRFIDTRKKDKQRKKQSKNSYIKNTANYNLKFSLHRNSKVSKRKEILPSAALNYKYAEQKIKLTRINSINKDYVPKNNEYDVNFATMQNINNYLNITVIKTEILNQSINSRKNSYWKKYWTDNPPNLGSWPPNVTYRQSKAQNNVSNTS